MPEVEANKIVIVEDEGLIANDLKGRLTAVGYIVPAIAASSSEALRVIRQSAPDLVLMDIRIKGSLDGIQVAEKVRAEFDIPVVYLTAYEDRGTLERAAETQAYGYIKKPIVSASLQGSIELALAKHRHERQLREQRDWALSSFAAVPYAVVVIDRENRISYVNAIAEALVGCSADTALGRQSTELLRLFYCENDEAVEDLAPLAMRTGESIPFPPDVALHRTGRPPCPVEGIVTPRWSRRAVDGAVVVLRDATAIRFAEEHSRQDSKHESLRRMAGMVLSNLPDWQMVVWNTTLLLDSIESGRLRENAEMVDRAALDGFETSRQLAVLADPPEVHLERVNLNDLVVELAPSWNEPASGFVLQIDPDPIPAQADPSQLAAVLSSIVNHAHTHVQGGGRIAIEVSHPESEQLRHWARVRIAYPTSAETPATLERTFEPAAKNAPPDLYAAYGSVKAMGGLLTVHRDRDDLVNFDVHLPRLIAATVAASVPAAQNGKRPERPAKRPEYTAS